MFSSPCLPFRGSVVAGRPQPHQREPRPAAAGSGRQQGGTPPSSWRTTASTVRSDCKLSTVIWSGSPSASAAPSRCRPAGLSLLVRSTSGPRGSCPRRCANGLPRHSHQSDPRAMARPGSARGVSLCYRGLKKLTLVGIKLYESPCSQLLLLLS